MKRCSSLAGALAVAAGAGGVQPRRRQPGTSRAIRRPRRSPSTEDRHLRRCRRRPTGTYYKDVIVGTGRDAGSEPGSTSSSDVRRLSEERLAVRRSRSSSRSRLSDAARRAAGWDARHEGRRRTHHRHPVGARVRQRVAASGVPPNSTLVFDVNARIRFRSTDRRVASRVVGALGDRFDAHVRPSPEARTMKRLLISLRAGRHRSCRAPPSSPQTGTTDPVLKRIWTLGMDSSRTLGSRADVLRLDRPAPHRHAAGHVRRAIG